MKRISVFAYRCLQSRPTGVPLRWLHLHQRRTAQTPGEPTRVTQNVEGSLPRQALKIHRVLSGVLAAAKGRRQTAAKTNYCPFIRLVSVWY